MTKKKKSAGILAYRYANDEIEFLLAHPGGPFFARKDAGAWSIPKGELDEGEEPLAAARREFAEETGSPVTGIFTELQPIVQKSGKTVLAWAVAADVETSTFKSNTFSMEWPAKSGKLRDFPEIDKLEWFTADAARQKINAMQAAFIDQVIALSDLK